MHIITKRIQYALALLAGIAVLAVLAFGVWHTGQVRAAGQSVGCTDLNASATARNGCATNGTTTPQYLAAGAATTTIAVNTANASAISLNLTATASTTSSVILFTVQYSNNAIDWYNEDANSTSGAVETHTATNLYHTWTPGVTATTSRTFNITTHASRFTRVGIEAMGAAAAVYPQVILQNQSPN